MTRRDLSRALLLIILLASVALRGAVALGNTNVETGACSVATAGSANVTATNINCIFGFTSDQVKELIEAAARGATSASTSTIVELSKQLSITEDATKISAAHCGRAGRATGTAVRDPEPGRQ